jgi:hypothetical protein
MFVLATGHTPTTHSEDEMSTKTHLTLTAELLTARYGTPSPTLRVVGPRDLHHREFSAALHDLAAAVERATPRNERWSVTRDRDGDTVGRITIEVAEGDAREVEAAMAVLKKVIG